MCDHRKDPKRQCHVCLEDFKSGDEIRTISCMHSFHTGCIDPVSSALRWPKFQHFVVRTVA